MHEGLLRREQRTSCPKQHDVNERHPRAIRDPVVSISHKPSRGGMHEGLLRREQHTHCRKQHDVDERHPRAIRDPVVSIKGPSKAEAACMRDC